MNAAARNRFVLPREETTAPRGRLILPEPRDREPAVPVRKPALAPAPAANPPQAYVPYGSPAPRPYGRQRFAPADNSMMTLAIVGVVITVVMGLPLGIVTGPMALKRAAQNEQLIRTGRRPRSDESTATTTRVLAWLSIAWSIPLIAAYLLVLFLLLAVAA
jgi:hypothetical protein